MNLSAFGSERTQKVPNKGGIPLIYWPTISDIANARPFRKRGTSTKRHPNCIIYLAKAISS